MNSSEMKIFAITPASTASACSETETTVLTQQSNQGSVASSVSNATDTARLQQQQQQQRNHKFKYTHNGAGNKSGQLLQKYHNNSNANINNQKNTGNKHNKRNNQRQQLLQLNANTLHRKKYYNLQQQPHFFFQQQQQRQHQQQTTVTQNKQIHDYNGMNNQNLLLIQPDENKTFAGIRHINNPKHSNNNNNNNNSNNNNNNNNILEILQGSCAAGDTIKSFSKTDINQKCCNSIYNNYAHLTDDNLSASSPVGSSNYCSACSSSILEAETVCNTSNGNLLNAPKNAINSSEYKLQKNSGPTKRKSYWKSLHNSKQQPQPQQQQKQYAISKTADVHKNNNASDLQQQAVHIQFKTYDRLLDRSSTSLDGDIVEGNLMHINAAQKATISTTLADSNSNKDVVVNNMANGNNFEQSRRGICAKEGVNNNSSSKKGPTEQQQQQHQHHFYYPQPQQITIASFLQKELLAVEKLQQNNNSSHNCTQFNSQLQQQPQQRYINYNHNQQQHRQQQQQQQQHHPHHHHHHHQYQNYRYQHNKKEYEYQLQQQQPHCQPQQHHSHQQRIQPFMRRKQHGVKKTNITITSTSQTQASLCLTTSSLSNLSTLTSSACHPLQQQQQQKQQQQQAKTIETLSGSNNFSGFYRSVGRSAHNYYTHHYGSQHSGATTPTTPQHQNFHNLTYVNMDPLNIPAKNACDATYATSPMSSLNSTTSWSSASASSKSATPSVCLPGKSRIEVTGTPTTTTSLLESTNPAKILTTQNNVQLCCATNIVGQRDIVLPIHLNDNTSLKSLPTSTTVTVNAPSNIICCSQLDEAITSAAATGTNVETIEHTERAWVNSTSVSAVTGAGDADARQLFTQCLPQISPLLCSQSFSSYPLASPQTQQQSRQQMAVTSTSSRYQLPMAVSPNVDSVASPLLSPVTDIQKQQHLKFFSFDNSSAAAAATACWQQTLATTPTYISGINCNSTNLLLPPNNYQNSPVFEACNTFIVRRASTASTVSTNSSSSCCATASDLLGSRLQHHRQIQMENIKTSTRLGAPAYQQEECTSQIAEFNSSTKTQQSQHQQHKHKPQHQQNTMREIGMGSALSTSTMLDYSTPSDNFLANAQNIELREPPMQLLRKCKYDKLSYDMWSRFVISQQTHQMFIVKLRLWRYLFLMIKQTYPRYGLYLVGSTMNGFGTNNSDIDMCLVLKGAQLPSNSDMRHEALYVLGLLHHCLFTTGDFYSFKLIQARVPILRFKDGANDIEVDLNFNNSVGIKNTHLLRLYSQLDWRIRPLVVLVKLWAQFHDINDAKRMTISSYSLVLMVIHFLQYGCSPNVLPCLHAMYPEKFQLRTTDYAHLDMNEVIEPYQTKNTQTLGELLIEFFKYYSFFDFRSYAISVRTGGLLPINECRASKQHKNDINQWKELNIEEPFDLSNTARSVYHTETFERVKYIFFTSWHLLKETLELNSIFTPLLTAPIVNKPFDQYIRDNCSNINMQATGSTIIKNGDTAAAVDVCADVSVFTDTTNTSDISSQSLLSTYQSDSISTTVDSSLEI